MAGTSIMAGIGRRQGKYVHIHTRLKKLGIPRTHTQSM